MYLQFALQIFPEWHQHHEHFAKREPGCSTENIKEYFTVKEKRNTENWGFFEQFGNFE